jgi:hypothetical protein
MESSQEMQFAEIPNEVIKIMLERLGVGAICNFAKTSRRFFSLFSEERRLISLLLNKFLLHVVRGEQEEAESLVQIFPELLLLKGKVTDYSGREIEGTALQIALGAEDVRYHENEVCMVEMLEKYFKKIPNDEAEKIKQIKEQFPPGWEKIEAERHKNDMQALHQVVEAIAKAPEGDECEEAIQAFRNYLAPKRVIKTGKHFNTQLLVEAFKLYHNKKRGYQFGGYNGHKNELFWRKVIGYIERYVPANLAQALCQDPQYIVEHKKKLRRSLKFRYYHARGSFYPLDSDNYTRLGYRCAVDGGVDGDCCPIGYWGGQAVAIYVNQKTLTLQNFVPQGPTHTQSCCNAI